VIHLATVAGGHLHGSEETVVFCSYCGRIGGDDSRRVCPSCGLGITLRTDSRALHSAGAPFLVVLADGRISAVSAAAERELGVGAEIVGGPLLALLASPAGEGHLSRAVAQAATGGAGIVRLPVARAHGRRFRGDLEATIARCGDPAAALLVLARRRNA
jgi:PAS domain-containing protein